jgi:hypothetical protein
MTNFVTPPHTDKAESLSGLLKKRFELLGQAQSLLTQYNVKGRTGNRHRTIGCHICRVDAGKPVVGIHVPGQNAGFFANLQKCGNVHACPVCGAKISERRRLELQAGLDHLVSHGHSYAMATFTLQHRHGETAATVRGRVVSAFRKIFAGEPGRRLRAKFGILGFVKNIETPYGANGWHVHPHVIFVFETSFHGLNEAFAAEFESYIGQRWRWVVKRMGGYADTDHGFKMTWGAQDIAGYVTKMNDDSDWTLAHELSKGVVKRGRNGSRTPTQLLIDSAYGDSDAGRLWVEYVQAFSGKQQLAYTPGLKKLMGLEEKTDEEIAGEEKERGQALVEFEAGSWDAVVGNDIRAEVLTYIGRGDAAGLKLFLRDFDILDGVWFPDWDTDTG